MILKHSKKGAYSPSDWLDLFIVIISMAIVLGVLMYMSHFKANETKIVEEILSTEHLAQRHLLTYSQLTIDFNYQKTSIAQRLSDFTYESKFKLDELTEEKLTQLANEYFSNIPNSRITLKIKTLTSDVEQYIYGSENYRGCNILSTISLPSNERYEDYVELMYEHCKTLPPSDKKPPKLENINIQ